MVSTEFGELSQFYKVMTICSPHFHIPGWGRLLGRSLFMRGLGLPSFGIPIATSQGTQTFQWAGQPSFYVT